VSVVASALAAFHKTRFKLQKWNIHRLPRRSWRVLDIGSGDGPSPAADVLCDRFIGDDTERTAPLRLDRPFVLGDVQCLPFVDKAFDFVYCSHLLEHTFHPEKAIAELERVASAGYIEVPSEYLEKAAKSTAAHLWFVRREEGALVFAPKTAGVIDQRVNDLFDNELMHKDPLYTAFHWANFYRLFNISLEWSGRVPFRVEKRPEAWNGDFAKGREAAMTDADVSALGQVVRRARDTAYQERGVGPSVKRWLKARLRAHYAKGKNFDVRSLLACPLCRSKLETGADRSVCPSCRKWYPWAEGVPCLVPEAARDLR